MDCSQPGSSVHGIFQAIVLEWIPISFSRGSSGPRDRTQVSHIVDRCFTIWATREDLKYNKLDKMKRQRNMLQMKEESKNWQQQINEEELGNSPEKEFRVMIIKMIQNIENKMQAQINRLGA